MASSNVVVPYDPKVFHEIQLLNPARAEFDDKDGPEFVDDVLGPLIVHHGMSDFLGAILVHRHADIGSDEFLVEFNRCTTPWKRPSARTETGSVVKSRSIIFPTSWTLTESGDWMPYEFCFSPLGTTGKNIVDLNEEKFSAFLDAYKAAIMMANLEKVVGLTVWPGNGFNGGMEFSEGTSNFWLIPGEFTEAEQTNSTETTWFYEPVGCSKRVRCVCECLYNVRGFHRLIHDHEKQYY